MSRISLFATLLTAFLLGAAAPADDQKTPLATAQKAPVSEDAHAATFVECAKVCDDCARSCDVCAAHCAKMIANGSKHHLATLKTCQDCAALCKAASCIVVKQGPFSDIACTACADACKRCGDACESHGGDDPIMKACAAECHKCEKACRDMVKQTSHAGGR